LLGITTPHLLNLVAAGQLSRIGHTYDLGEVLRLASRRAKQPPRGRPTSRAMAASAIDEMRRRQHRGMNHIAGFDDLVPAGVAEGE
jgi:hypothetical protein